ncbi:MAG: FHA domain-containing protein [Candidatus Hydrogenedentota bacterium]
MEQGYADTLAVINGPEDGAEFALTRSPITIGQTADCAVVVRLDNTVQERHATATAVAGGYRIRSTGGPVYVGGKRTGSVRSRVLRPGEVLRVGYTEFVLECAPGGLASRSRGVSMESDAIWFLRKLTDLFAGVIASVIGLLFSLVRGIQRHWTWIAVPGFVFLFWFAPPFRNFVYRLINTVLGILREIFAQISG